MSAQFRFVYFEFCDAVIFVQGISILSYYNNQGAVPMFRSQRPDVLFFIGVTYNPLTDYTLAYFIAFLDEIYSG